MAVTRNPITVEVVRNEHGLCVRSTVEIPELPGDERWLKPMHVLDESFLAISGGNPVKAYDAAVKMQADMIRRCWDFLDKVPGIYEDYEGTVVKIPGTVYDEQGNFVCEVCA